MLQAARIPGAAVALVGSSGTVFEAALGVRDLTSKRELTSETPYPIASTSKAMNAILIAGLVEKGLLDWDEPVRSYLPSFALRDEEATRKASLRDLVAMRTGLPRHDWVWRERRVSRSDLAKSLRHLEPSAPFRARFQYNNLSATAAGHVAEAVTGIPWERLVTSHIFEPLRMASTAPQPLSTIEMVSGYHENDARELIRSRVVESQSIAPAGGGIVSTLRDMSRWVAANLDATGDALRLTPAALREVRKPQIVAGDDATAPSVNASYALGWFVDAFGGSERLSHGGDLFDVNSNVMLLPEHGLGAVAFTTFGASRMASWINELVLGAWIGLPPALSMDDKLRLYEEKISNNRERRSWRAPSQGQEEAKVAYDYAGEYLHAAYGRIVIAQYGRDLLVLKDGLALRANFCGPDLFTCDDGALFGIHSPNPFDCAGCLKFARARGGQIEGLSIALEPAVGPILFERRQRPVGVAAAPPS
jgi:CubicO group peptidase (beta-lactamase class C family)